MTLSPTEQARAGTNFNNVIMADSSVQEASNIRAGINSDNLAPSKTTPTVTSDYMSYGSYSGADIKVVVHVPKSQVVINELNREKEGIQNEINEAEIDNISIKNTRETIEEIQDLIDLESSDVKLNVLYRQLEEAEEKIKAYNDIPTTITLGEVQSISWSIFREKVPVRVLGSVYPRAYTRGPRTIGGSMVFTVFHKHAMHELLEANFKHYSTGTSDYDKQQYTSMLIDQLPPLDISLVFANEYGAVSHMGIYGIDFSQEGGTFSIEDIFSESVVQYTARDLDPMKVAQTAIRNKQGLTNEWTKTATQLMAEEDSLYGHLKRRNPFI